MYRIVTYNSRINSDDLIFYDNLYGDRGVDYIAPSEFTILSQKFKPNKSFLMRLLFIPDASGILMKICDMNFKGIDFSISNGSFVITGYNQTPIKCTPVVIDSNTNIHDTKFILFYGVFNANNNNTYKLNDTSLTFLKDINTPIAIGTINTNSLAVSKSATYVMVSNKAAFKSLIIKYI